jgi:hypothetical protein
MVGCRTRVYRGHALLVVFGPAASKFTPHSIQEKTRKSLQLYPHKNLYFKSSSAVFTTMMGLEVQTPVLARALVFQSQTSAWPIFPTTDISSIPQRVLSFLANNKALTIFGILFVNNFIRSVYRLYFHPSKFPGPKIAAISDVCTYLRCSGRPIFNEPIADLVWLHSYYWTIYMDHESTPREIWLVPHEVSTFIPEIR